MGSQGGTVRHMSMELYPLMFRPVYQGYLWGGSRIAETYGRDVPFPVVAESWEISAHPDGAGVVDNGPLAGRLLSELVAEYGEALLGEGRALEVFPLLIKVLDARECLSVQVHPNDDDAMRHGGQPKTEMWYILDADDDAGVYAGFCRDVTREEVGTAIADQTLASLLRREPVRSGDAVFVPGGLVHAIDAGCLLLEVQQSSNTTYRLYDWGRVGADGQPRDLHVAEAGHVMMLNEQLTSKVVPKRLASGEWGESWLVCTSPYFRMERLCLDSVYEDAADPTTFRVFFCAEGEASLTVGGVSVPLVSGQSCLVPANSSAATIVPTGRTVILRVTLPRV